MYCTVWFTVIGLALDYIEWITHCYNWLCSFILDSAAARDQHSHCNHSECGIIWSWEFFFFPRWSKNVLLIHSKRPHQPRLSTFVIKYDLLCVEPGVMAWSMSMIPKYSSHHMTRHFCLVISRYDMTVHHMTIWHLCCLAMTWHHIMT